MAEILSYPVIQYKSAINDLTMKLFRQYRSDLDVLYIDDFNSLWKLAQIGNYSFLSPSLSLKHRRQSQLKALRIRDFDYHCTVCYVHNSTPMTAAEREIAAQLKEVSKRL